MYWKSSMWLSFYILFFVLQVLTDPDHCYCVLLNAHGGAAFPSSKTPHDSSSSDNSLLKTDSDNGKKNKTKVWLHPYFIRI